MSLRAHLAGVELNGRAVPFNINTTELDQHVTVRFPVSATSNTLRIRIKNDFGLSLSPSLPPLGNSSQGLRVISESWTPSRDSLTLEVSGTPGKEYEIAVWNPAQVNSVENAELVKSGSQEAKLNFRLPANASEPYAREKITIHFSGKAQ